MQTCRDYLAAVKARQGIKSDYRLAIVLGVTQSAVNQWQSGRTTFSDEIALKIAALLEIDAGQVLASMRAERAADPILRAIWERVATKAAAALILAACASTMYPAQDAAARPLAPSAEGVCITSNRRRKPRSARGGKKSRLALALRQVKSRLTHSHKAAAQLT